MSTLTLRQISAVLPPEHAWGLFLSRRILAGVMDAFGPPQAGARADKVDGVLPDGRRVIGEWVWAPGVETTDSAIYFVHGSGYALSSPRTHRRLTSWLSRLTGLPVFVIDYRLAPRHRFPTAADDVRAGWDWLTGHVPPERIVVAADSAGGHLTVDLLLQADTAAGKAAALVLFSPLIDLTLGLSRAREALRRDPAIRVADARRLLALYTRGVDPTHQRLTLDVAGGPALPPTLIRAGGGRCELQVWPDQVHVFQALPRLSPEAVKAMAQAARFIRTSLRASGFDAAAGKAG